MKSYEPYPRGVSVICYRDGKFLVSQRINKDKSHGMWQFPGGCVEKDEAPVRAASRELVEETGLFLHVEWFIHLGTTPPMMGYKGELYVGDRFGLVLREQDIPQLTEPDKNTPWEWRTLEQLQPLEMLPRTKEYAARLQSMVEEAAVEPQWNPSRDGFVQSKGGAWEIKPRYWGRVKATEYGLYRLGQRLGPFGTQRAAKEAAQAYVAKYHHTATK